MTLVATLAATLSMAVAPATQYPELEKNLLPVGSKVPDVTLTTASGKQAKLMAMLKGKKATILNFWFYN